MALVIPPPTATTADFSGCHVLICDPYLANRRLLRDTMTTLGCRTVDDCANLHEVRKRIEAGGVNLLFLDWSGETDAMTFLRAIRSAEHPLRFLPVVVMTAYDGLDHVLAARDAGATEFMLRPWSYQVVESRLRSVVHHPRLFIEGGRFFGPDRRRRHGAFPGPERRSHENWKAADRRVNPAAGWKGPERRQGRPGFQPLERRDAPRV